MKTLLAPARLDPDMADRKNRLMETMRHRPVVMVDKRNRLMMMMTRRLDLVTADRRNRPTVTMRHRRVDIVDRRNHLMVKMTQQLDPVTADRRNRPTVTMRHRPVTMDQKPSPAMARNLPMVVEGFRTISPQELVTVPAGAMILMTFHRVTLDALQATPTVRTRLTVARLEQRRIPDLEMMM